MATAHRDIREKGAVRPLRLVTLRLAGSLVTLGLLGTSGAVCAQAAIHTPDFGTSERKSILDTLRPSAEQVWHSPVVFVVKEIRVSGGFAYVSVVPERPNGAPIRMMLAGGTGNAYGSGFLRYAGGRWTVLSFRGGASDAWECGYPGIPRSILPSYC